jgi:sterol desaturase/sphingolipid hydroxylase (fatty acid hydroxylase superfamily)
VTSYPHDWSAVARGLAVAVPLAVVAVYKLAKEGAANIKHDAVNLACGMVGIVLIAVFAGPRINDFNAFVDSRGMGILHRFKIEGWANVAASIVILDFLGWWWHYATHKLKPLWRVHQVHHSDLELNFSTTYRTHWAETAAEIAARMAQYAIVGPSLVAIAIYELLIILLSQYQHVDVKMPERWESRLSAVFITARMHYVHHSTSPDDYGSNYGFIFSCWDAMLGTYRTFEQARAGSRLTTGIGEYPDASKLTFSALLWMPFRPLSGDAAAASRELLDLPNADASASNEPSFRS